MAQGTFDVQSGVGAQAGGLDGGGQTPHLLFDGVQADHVLEFGQRLVDRNGFVVLPCARLGGTVPGGVRRTAAHRRGLGVRSTGSHGLLGPGSVLGAFAFVLAALLDDLVGGEQPPQQAGARRDVERGDPGLTGEGFDDHAEQGHGEPDDESRGEGQQTGVPDGELADAARDQGHRQGQWEDEEDDGSARQGDLEQGHGDGQPQHADQHGEERVEGPHQSAEGDEGQGRADQDREHRHAQDEGDDRDHRDQDQCRHETAAQRYTVVGRA